METQAVRDPMDLQGTREKQGLWDLRDQQVPLGSWGPPVQVEHQVNVRIFFIAGYFSIV